MLRISILLFLFICLQAQKNTIITDYSAYLDKWKEIAHTKEIVNVTSMGSQDEKCNDRACEFYYYVRVNQELVRSGSRNTTVLIVAGLKGNDYLAVNSMLNVYGKIDAARVVYFPLANPSGFIKNMSKTYPNEVEIPSDFPTSKNAKECFKSSASRILDSIYRKYQVDVTILIEDGELSLRYRSAKSLNGKVASLQHEEIFDYLYSRITKKSMELEERFKQKGQAQTFTISDASNGFIDWVYGVPMFPSYFDSTCSTKVQDTQKPKKKGIAFGLSIGKLSDKNLNFIQQRTPILLQQISFIANPKIFFNPPEQNMMEVKLKGCSTANITSISILLNELEHQLLSESVEFDNLNYESKFIELSNFQFLGIEAKEKKIRFKYTCHGRWVPKENNVFIQAKQYQQQHDLQMKSKENKVQEQLKQTTTKQDTLNRNQQKLDKPRDTELKQTKSSRVELVQSQKQQEYIDKVSKNAQPTTSEQLPVSLLKDLLKTILVGGLVIVTVCYLINCLKVGKAVFLSRTRRYEQKFEEVEYTQNLQEQNPPEPNQENSQLVSR